MESLRLVQENVTKKNINLRIICQKNKSREKLSSTDNLAMVEQIYLLQDELFEKFDGNNVLNCSCYKSYVLRSGRQSKNKLVVCYCQVTYEFQSDSTIYSLPECQVTPCSKQAPYLKFNWQQWDSNPQPINS